MNDYPSFKVKIGGRQYTVVLVPVGVNLPDFHMKENGACDPPYKRDKKIYIREGLSEKKEFEVFLHELLHAALWMASEEWITDTALEIANAFYLQRGWRRKSTE